ncbi:MAG: hypothetical protein DMF59_05835 [Acidobacteria bacterium]|nr:MAG: hypothetical protein DMF59_05835 [Acidobacteriota bacterium]
MRSRIFIYCATIALLASTNAVAANVAVTERLIKDLSLENDGTLWIDNAIGNIDVVGSDVANMGVTVFKTTTAVDRAALDEGREQTVISFEGNQSSRLVRTILPGVLSPRWTSAVSYVIRVPRTTHIRIATRRADRIHIANISSDVTVKSFAGTIIVDGVTGGSIVDTINGKVVYIYRQKPTAGAQIQAVNADIYVNVPPDSNFNWIADTLRGDVLTNLPVRAEFLSNVFRGAVNAPGGPILSMQTLLGNIHLLGNGLDPQKTHSLRESAAADSRTLRRVQTKTTLMMQPAKRIQLPIAMGSFDLSASVADVEVGEVRGPARVETGAGEIKLGTVNGECNVISGGGPLQLGDVIGPLFASTQAGEVFVRAARVVGRLFTAGGSIYLLYTGGTTALQSGGGDIVVRQAAGSINAETRSGDINITADPNQKMQKIEARSGRGNITLYLTPGFSADIDAMIVSAEPDVYSISSDFKGLQVTTEQVGGKTRVRAMGKINGGGEHVELYAEEGDIHILNLTTNPVTIMPRP